MDNQLALNEDLLRLTPQCLIFCVADNDVDELAAAFGPGFNLPSHLSLAHVAARYSLQTLPQPSETTPGQVAYSLFLLSAWIWDDIVDQHHSRSNPKLHGLVERAIPFLKKSLDLPSGSGLSTAGLYNFHHGSSKVDSFDFDQPLWEDVETSARLMKDAMTLVELEYKGFRPRIAVQIGRFIESFLEKSNLLHLSNTSLRDYSRLRAICVGMLPCFEFSYASKVKQFGLTEEQILPLLKNQKVSQCARICSLHCAAVNDLFSLHKDRVVEDTANFPSVLSPNHTVEGYVQGSLDTVDYIRRLVEEFRVTVESWKAPACEKEIIVGTWVEMMAGNIRFHLNSRRYASAVQMVIAALDPSLSRGEQEAVFRSSLLPPPYIASERCSA